MKGVLPDKVHRIYRDRRFPDHGRTGFGKDRKLPGDDSGGSQCAGIQLRLPDAHHIAGLVQRHVDMRRAGVVLDAAVGVVAENGHQSGRLIEVRETGTELPVIPVKGGAELFVVHENGEEHHEDRGGVVLGLVGHIGLQNLGGAVIDAGHQAAAVAVIDDQMIGVRPGGGFVLCYSAVVDDTDRAFSGAAHAAADGMDRLDNRSAERGDRSVSVGGGDGDLLALERVEGCGERTVEGKQICGRGAHS